MSVIGRLDEQVSKVLIEPLGKQRRTAETPPTPEMPPDESLTRARTASDSITRERAAAARELPVWLL